MENTLPQIDFSRCFKPLPIHLINSKTPNFIMELLDKIELERYRNNDL